MRPSLVLERDHHVDNLHTLSFLVALIRTRTRLDWLVFIHSTLHVQHERLRVLILWCFLNSD